LPWKTPDENAIRTDEVISETARVHHIAVRLGGMAPR